MGELTLDILQELLVKEYPDVTVKEFEETQASKPGDNYCSMVYRVALRGTQKLREMEDDLPDEIPWEYSLIYKCLPKSTIRREAFKSDALFCNEHAFYTKICSAFMEFQRENLKENCEPFNSIPKCFLAHEDKIILKDLNDEGFTMPNRKNNLSCDQVFAVLKVLAQFHAISLAMKYENPEEFYDLLNIEDGISEALFSEGNEDWYREYYRQATRNAIAMVEQDLESEEDREKYLGKFRAFCSEESFFINMVELVRPKEPLAVINHGDCWTNNFLFRYSQDGVIEQVCLIDFQLVRYASPTLDLAYLIFLCMSSEQRSEILPKLLDFYTETLHTRLIELTREDSVFHTELNKDALKEMLKEEFRRSAQFGLGLAIDMYPIMTCDSDEAPNLYQAKETENISPDSVTPVWTSSVECRRRMTDLLKEMVDNNYL